LGTVSVCFSPGWLMSQLDVAAALGKDEEAEALDDGDDLRSG
jgi:hypothetical protein